MLTLLKRVLPEKLKKKLKNDLEVPSLSWGLIHLKKKGVYPKSVLDVGAYHGDWTNEFLEVFPSSQVLMIEGQTKLLTHLQKTCEINKNITCYNALISSVDGESLYFTENETASNASRAYTKSGILKKSETIDTIIAKTGFPAPDFIKIDIQGFELEALKGATKALETTEICLLEVTVMNIGGGEPLLLEVLRFMDERGYQLYDIVHLMRIPYDRTLFQMDVFFVKKTSNIIQLKRWE